MRTTFGEVLSRFWWLLLIRGVISVIFGVIVFTSPGITLASLLFLFGAYVLVDGVGNVVTAIGGRDAQEDWWVLLLAGLAGIGVGLLTLSRPGVTALVLLFYIAIWAIASGVLHIVAAIRLRKVVEGELWMVLGGLASVLFGIILVANPGEGALTLLWLIGAYAVAFGAITILLALRARRFAGRVAGAPAAT
jgi:uncharacterized membrane protein HdeD (DUF308 family)